MGIIKKIEENNCIIAIWNLQESLEELTQQSANISIPDFNNEKRQKEYLASRLLLKDITPNTKITYNEYGAPKLENGKHISISHSKNLVAIIISKQKVGIDIEQISKKPLRLSSKFISDNTHQNLTKEKATLIWCCKEAIYKWYQKGNIDFIKDIKLYNFEIAEKGILTTEFKTERLFLNYQKIHNHYLVYVCK
jgi:4'-phosphopantetheinyl transferase